MLLFALSKIYTERISEIISAKTENVGPSSYMVLYNGLSL